MTETTDIKWVSICRRTNDPKLRYFQALLDQENIPNRRNGNSFHAPILEVPSDKNEAAWDLLTSDVFGDGTVYDEIPDDDPVFGDFEYEEGDLE